jgi:multisubunit Na+/H+ antiporter MnhC subunit
VRVGQYIIETLPTPLSYVGDGTSEPLPLVIIIPVVVGGLAVVAFFFILIICCVVCYHSRKVRVLKGELGWTNMMNQIELSKLQRES